MKCSKSCRYFDAHGVGSLGDCRAVGSTLKCHRFAGGIVSVSGGHETRPGKPCPHKGPYLLPAYYGSEGEQP